MEVEQAKCCNALSASPHPRPLPQTRRWQRVYEAGRAALPNGSHQAGVRNLCALEALECGEAAGVGEDGNTDMARHGTRERGTKLAASWQHLEDARVGAQRGRQPA